MRNIHRVVLWELPPSFCSLVQRAGRAGRDFNTLAEAILIVPASVIKNGTTDSDIESVLQEVVDDVQAENRGDEEQGVLEQNGIEVTSGNEEILVNDGGVRLAHDGSDDGEENEPEGKTQRRKKFSKESNSHEARYLSLFVCTKQCQRVIWDQFFDNKRKCEFHTFTVNVMVLDNSTCLDSPTHLSDKYHISASTEHALLRQL
jgi:hypothetical protein